MMPPPNKLILVTLAGIYTAPNFLDEFREALAEKLRDDSGSVRTFTFFPYGDWSRGKLAQTTEIAVDLLLPAVGVRRILRELKRETGPDVACANECIYVLAGHSGGGVAAVQAAAKLQCEGKRVGGVVMIGSPKIPVPARLRDRTVHLQSVDGTGRSTDPVAKLGAWRGRPPAFSWKVPLIGGHPDYFRTQEPYVNREGQSNLAVVLEMIYPWLLQQLKKPSDL